VASFRDAIFRKMKKTVFIRYIGLQTSKMLTSTLNQANLWFILSELRVVHLDYEMDSGATESGDME